MPKLSTTAISLIKGDKSLQSAINTELGIESATIRYHVRHNRNNGKMCQHSVIMLISKHTGVAPELLLTEDVPTPSFA